MRTCSAREEQSRYLHGLRTLSETRVSDRRASRCSFSADSKKTAKTPKPAEAMSMSEEGHPSASQVTELSEIPSKETENQDNGRRKLYGLTMCCTCVFAAALLFLLALTVLSDVTTDGCPGTGKDPLDMKPSAGAPASRPVSVAERTTTLLTTTESDFDVEVNYSDPVYNDLHQYICMFDASWSGRKVHGRTYRIDFFPYQFCHIILYCCYALDANMQLVPELPDVDRDAVQRGAAFKLKNKFLYMYLAVRGPDIFFDLLFRNESNEYAAFLKNARAWLKDNKFDGIRLWWKNAPYYHRESIVDLGRYVAADLYTTRMSMGYIVPSEQNFEELYSIPELPRALLVRHTIILYKALPRNIARLEYYDKEVFGAEPTESNFELDFRNLYCHLLPLGALSFKLEAPCDVSDSTELEQLVVTDVGDAGPFTRTRGTLATYEACDIMYANGSEWQFKDETKFMYACNNLSAIIFTTPPQALNFLEAVHDVFYGTCFGYVNPHYDDFPGRCRLGKYPGEPYSWIRESFHLMSDSVKGKTGGHLDPKLPLNLRHEQNASAAGK